jgi:hypothetical protein
MILTHLLMFKFLSGASPSGAAPPATADFIVYARRRMNR